MENANPLQIILIGIPLSLAVFYIILMPTKTVKYLLIFLIAMYGVATYIDHTLVIDNCKPQDCVYENN